MTQSRSQKHPQKPITKDSARFVQKPVLKDSAHAARPLPGKASVRSKSTKPTAVAAVVAKGEPCPVYKKCGGCQLQNMTYEKQLCWKQGRVQMLLGKHGNAEKIIGMEYPYHYRNKVQAAFGVDAHGKILSGVYQSGTHRIVMVDQCMTEDKKADEIIVTIRELLPKCKIVPFDERKGTGFLRHVLVKRGFQSGQIMVVLVAARSLFTAKKHFLRALLERHPEITTVLLNINDRFTSMVLGDEERVLYGKGRIEESLCGLQFSISAKAFYQINPVQTEVLYRKAIDFAQLTGNETVIDAYCGVGTIGMIAASGAGRVIGVENNSSAVQDAWENAKRNQIKNIRFVCGDAGTFMQEMAADGGQADVVFMDPPRSGSDTRFLRALLQLAPRRVVYISCNPETQARDLEILRKDYQIERIQPVDMFPHTHHVETVALLSLKSGTPKIEVTMEVDSDSNYSPEEKATYQKIKEYVKDKYGLSVTNLYIAQIKDKCGLDKRLNYNLPKSENAKKPKCTEEKEIAILDAFKHFGLV